MTDDQIKYRDFIIKIFKDHNQDIVSALAYATRHRLPYAVQDANRNLSVQQRNEVIEEILYAGRVMLWR